MSSYKDRQSADILNSVYKNAEMAYESSGDVLRRCKNARLYSEIAKQRERYKNISAEALGELQRRGVKAQQTPPAAKAMAKMGIAMQTVADTSSSHIAALMIRGTTMGIIDMQQTLNRSAAAEEDLQSDARQLLRREQDYCERLKRFL